MDFGWFFLGLGFQPSPALCCCVRCSSFNPGGDFQIQISFWVYVQTKRGEKKFDLKAWVIPQPGDILFHQPGGWQTSSLLCREIHVMFCQCIKCRSKMSATNMVCDSAAPPDFSLWVAPIKKRKKKMAHQKWHISLMLSVYLCLSLFFFSFNKKKKRGRNYLWRCGLDCKLQKENLMLIIN